MFDLKRTGRSACATEEMTHPHAGSLRLGSLRLRSGRAGQAREDGAPVRALSGTAEDGRIAAGLLQINCVKLILQDNSRFCLTRMVNSLNIVNGPKEIIR